MHTATPSPTWNCSPVLKTKPDQAGVLAFTTKQAWSRFIEAITTTRGVIGGVTPSGKGHAVAYEYGHIYDPDGWMYDYSPAVCEQSEFLHAAPLVLGQDRGCRVSNNIERNNELYAAVRAGDAAAREAMICNNLWPCGR